MDTSVYDHKWLQFLEQFDPFLETAVLGVYALLGLPETMIDVGCGTGHTVEFSERLGVRSAGIEVAPVNVFGGMRGTYYHHDLTEPLVTWLSKSYEMVFCWEVAEHLPEEAADTLVNNLEFLTEKYLIFSAAHAGQGGDHHLNEQDFPYWKDKLEYFGTLRHDEELSDRLRLIWTYTTGPMHWLPENVQVLVRD